MGGDNRKELSFKVIEDLGEFGDRKWPYHLTLTQWGDNEPKYDLRPWNPDMTQMGKGITLTKDDLFDLFSILEDIFDGDDSEDDAENDEDEEN